MKEMQEEKEKSRSKKDETNHVKKYSFVLKQLLKALVV
jgi:hypothetical protein